MDLRPVKKESVSEQVFEQMKAQISSGSWKTGENCLQRPNWPEFFTSAG